jgi:hypothetical protein
MNRNRARRVVRVLAVALVAPMTLLAPRPGPVEAQSVIDFRPPSSCRCLAETKVISFYDNATIPAGIGISSGTYTNVDGYRFINIFVEFEQETFGEKPVSLGVAFAFDTKGTLGSGRYFNFEQNFTAPADPQLISLTGANSWHGSPHNVSRYTARLPVMGPYVQVFPFNHEGKDRKFSIRAYLST